VALSSGARLGPYEILEPLGAGGMGEVYRARDPRLKRDVALKVLPAELASEPERLERFEREAQTLAALNHPHIVTIFSVEETEDVRFLTMELVEGKTLTRVIPRGGLPLSRFFEIAIPLTEAVSAAHDKGVIHRDLKPSNVMVTEEDRVKVLDFGLAKLREGVRGAVDTQSPTEPATGPGRILGTAPYMSPEQVQGRPLDHRSDVFSLGIILYEMATGERPFAGDTFADIASSVLRDTPISVTDLRGDLPRDIARLVKHCLEKDPKRRFQSVLDLRNELEELKREVDSGALVSAEQTLKVGAAQRGPKRLGAAAAVVVLAASVVAWWSLSSRTAKPPPEDTADPIEITPLTSDGGLQWWPQLSPDGEKVAYVWVDPTRDNWDIYVKGLGLGTRPLPLTENPAWDTSPVWSPDGRQIAFVRAFEDGRALYTVPWPGGQERRLFNLKGPNRVRGYILTVLSWSPDGDWLAFPEKPSENEPARIVRLALATLEKEPLTSPPEDALGDFFPAFSPDGSQLAFVRLASTVGFGNHDVWVQPVGGGEPRRLTSERYDTILGPLAWTPDGGEVLFTSVAARTAIRRVSLAGGAPQPVAGVGDGAGLPSIRSRRMVYRQQTTTSGDIWRIPGRRASAPDGEPEKLIASSGDDWNPSYSPDGRKIAFSSNRTGVESIWVSDSDGSNAVQLTSFEAHAGTPRWSPDGRRIVFDSMEAGDWDIYVIDADGGVPRRLTQWSSDENRGSWSHEGQWIYFASDRSGDSQIWKIPSEGGPPVQVTRGGGIYAQESWDGQNLYVISEGPGIWKVPVGGGDAVQVVTDPVAWPDWAQSRSGIYYLNSREVVPHHRYVHTISFLDSESGRVTELFRNEGPFSLGSLGVSPDEEWILYNRQPLPTSELMLVENFR
jgi:Tol biopolymer transport system component